MSVYFNQTNLAPGTSFSGNSGSSSFPQGLNISQNGTNTKYIQIDPSVYWGQPSLAVENTSETSTAIPQPLSANPFFAFSWDGSNNNTSKSGSYGANSIVFQGNAGTGSNASFIAVRDAGLVNSATGLAFQMTCVSSMTSGAFTINAEKFCSTMQGYGWA